MSEQRAAVRANVSIPAELKDQMDAVSKGVNWSAVAAEAFRRKLLEIDSSREAKTMDEVIERLRAAKKLEDSETYQEGHEAGVCWAKSEARPRQLRNLQKWHDGLQDSLEGSLELMGDEDAVFGIDTELAGIIEGNDLDRRGGEEFWEVVLGEGGPERIAEGSFAHGFVEGALEVWAKVSRKI